jgi:AcrR family transcriptional regulator
MVISTHRKLGRPKDENLMSRRREEILHTAAHIFAQNGYSKTDLQVVADVLQISKGTIYRYFPSKRELFLAAVDRGMQSLLEATDESMEDIHDPLEKMAIGIHTYLTFFDDHPEFAELLIQERAEFKDRKKSTYFNYDDRVTPMWTVVFQRLIAEGRIRNTPVHRILDVIGNLLYGTMFTNFFAGRNKSCEDQAQDIIDVVFNGILSDREKVRRLEITTSRKV